MYHAATAKPLKLSLFCGSTKRNFKLEDLKVLRRSSDLINNVKIGHGFTAYNKTYFVIPYMGVAAILVK